LPLLLLRSGGLSFFACDEDDGKEEEDGDDEDDGNLTGLDGDSTIFMIFYSSGRLFCGLFLSPCGILGNLGCPTLEAFCPKFGFSILLFNVFWTVLNFNNGIAGPFL